VFTPIKVRVYNDETKFIIAETSLMNERESNGTMIAVMKIII